MRTDRRGFTLMEVLVALAIGGVVLTGARLLLEGLGDHARAVVRTSNDVDSRANAERTARQVVENLALAPELQPTFTGDATAAAFSSWCPSPYGDLAPCGVRVSVQHDTVGAVIVMSLAPGGDAVMLRSSTASLRYLANAANGGSWYTRWTDAISPPLAIGVYGATDTLILRIGERR